MTSQARHAAEAWLIRDPDRESRAAIEDILRDPDESVLRSLFTGRLGFGTAGLRATMGVGPQRMNRLVVREASAGIARYLLAQRSDGAGGEVVVAYDARHRSQEFAADCVEVLVAHGLDVVRATAPLPTPVGVFAIRHLRAAAGIIITASHNPADDNGMKLYLSDGAQIVAPVDETIAAAIDDVIADGVVAPMRTPSGSVRSLDVTPAYLAATGDRVPPPARQLRIATSAMHGVGGAVLAALLSTAGYSDVHPVASQERPDPAFPTVAFPNPEEPGATDLLADRVRELDAELGLCLDPDADRVAVLIRDGGTVRQLTGDEVGALLGEWLLADVTFGSDRLLVSSVVSSGLLAKIAAAHGAHYAETLTGFKWLCRPAIANPQWTQVLAYEEAIGYAIGPDVRDKDGLSAALAVASMASRGDLLERLDALHREHGAHVTENFSLRFAGDDWRARREATLAALTAAPPIEIGEEHGDAISWPAADVMRISLADGLRVVVRPSGTEPKLKCYCEAVEPVTNEGLRAARTRASARLGRIRPALEALLVAP